MSPVIVLDTTAFSGLIYANRPIVEQYRSKLQKGTPFLLCPVVWYETRRGLQKIAATRKLDRLIEVSRYFIWDNLVQEDWRLAADTWAVLATQGRRPGDADLLIAVFAARRGAKVVTSNRRHFDLLSEHLALTVEDWAPR